MELIGLEIKDANWGKLELFGVRGTLGDLHAVLLGECV
jgi:hypothetical protein